MKRCNSGKMSTTKLDIWELSTDTKKKTMVSTGDQPTRRSSRPRYRSCWKITKIHLRRSKLTIDLIFISISSTESLQKIIKMWRHFLIRNRIIWSKCLIHIWMNIQIPLGISDFSSKIKTYLKKWPWFEQRDQMLTWETPQNSSIAELSIKGVDLILRPVWHSIASVLLDPWQTSTRPAAHLFHNWAPTEKIDLKPWCTSWMKLNYPRNQTNNQPNLAITVEKFEAGNLASTQPIF